jgi:hypothetical protein
VSSLAKYLEECKQAAGAFVAEAEGEETVWFVAPFGGVLGCGPREVEFACAVYWDDPDDSRHHAIMITRGCQKNAEVRSNYLYN